MAPPKTPPARRRYIDRPEVPEAFADGVERITYDGSTLRMEFVVVRQDEEGGDLWAYTSARVVLTLNGMNDLFDKIDRLRASLQTRTGPLAS
jgi:hypothetical protein